MPFPSTRSLIPLPGALEAGLVPILGRVAIGAVGAVGAIVGGKGVESITRTSEGVYTIVLEDEPNKILAVEPSVICAAETQDCVAQVKSINAATKTVVLRTVEYDGDGVVSVVDPADGDELCFVLWLETKNVERI